MAHRSPLQVLSILCLACVSTAVVVTSRDATAQVQGTLPAFVRLQPASPGDTQHGHANIDGTMIAGTFQGSASGLNGLPVGAIDPGSANAGQVPMYDGSSVVWADVAGGALSLPFEGTTNSVLTAFRVTNGGGEAVRGIGPGGSYGSLGDSNYGARGFGPAGVFGLSSVQTGNYGLLGTGDAGVLAHSDNMVALKAEAYNGHGVDAFTHSAAHGAVTGRNMLSLNLGQLGTFNYGVYGQTENNYGVYGYATSNGAGLGGQNSSTGSRGLVGDRDYGVSAFSNAVAAVFANSGSAIGVWGRSQSGSDAIYGENTSSGIGVHGKGNIGVYGEAQAGYGVYGFSNSTANTAAVYGSSKGFAGAGVHGYSPHRGVRGDSTGGSGVYGFASGPGVLAYGVEGRSESPDGRGGLFSCFGEFGVGVAGYGDSSGVYTSTVGVYGQAWIGLYGAGEFGLKTTNYASIGVPNGAGLACGISGDLYVTGNKEFAIDHPLDPENYELRHYCTEGPVPMNAYSGNARTDNDGYAWVQLPEYFEALNKDFRYQLTVVDESRSADFVQVRVSSRIQSNRFQIQSSRGNVEVSWRVEAIRNDRYNQLNPPKDVLRKVGKRAGKFLTPSLWGQPESRGMDHVDLKGVSVPKNRP